MCAALLLQLLLLADYSAVALLRLPLRASPKHRRFAGSGVLPADQPQQGIVVSGVELGTIGGLRGIIATSAVGGIDLQASAPLVSVPARLVFEVTNARPPTPFPEFVPQALWAESMWDHRLAFKLLYELKVVGLDKSEKASWLQQLPSSYSTPLHWSPAVLREEAQYTALADKVEKQRQEWAALHAKWMAVTSLSGRDVSLEEFVKALECVNSRAFSGTFEGSSASERRSLLAFTAVLTVAFPALDFGTWEQSLSAALVVGLSLLAKDVIFSKASGLKRYVVCPFVDMFNHKSTVSSDVSYNYFADAFELRTQGHAKGDQVFISYGKQGNDRLLQYYGFIDEDNPHDSYDFGSGVLELLLRFGDAMMQAAGLPVGPAEVQSRLKVIAAALSVTEVDDATIRGSRGATVRGDQVPVRFFRQAPSGGSISGRGGFDSVTTRALRALYASRAEWAELVGVTGTIGSLERLGAPLSGETEALVASALRSLAQLELASKPTRLEEDVALLQGLKGKVAAGTSGGGGCEACDPSGLYQDPVFSAVAFRIEKKKLLLEAAT